MKSNCASLGLHQIRKKDRINPFTYSWFSVEAHPLLMGNFRLDCNLSGVGTIYFFSICAAPNTTGAWLEPLCAALTRVIYNNRNDTNKMSLQFTFNIMIVWLYFCQLWIKSMSFLYNRQHILLLKKQLNLIFKSKEVSGRCFILSFWINKQTFLLYPSNEYVLNEAIHLPELELFVILYSKSD